MQHDQRQDLSDLSSRDFVCYGVPWPEVVIDVPPRIAGLRILDVAKAIAQAELGAEQFDVLIEAMSKISDGLHD